MIGLRGRLGRRSREIKARPALVGWVTVLQVSGDAGLQVMLHFALICLGFLAIDINADQRSQACKECAESFETLALVNEKETASDSEQAE